MPGGGTRASTEEVDTMSRWTMTTPMLKQLESQVANLPVGLTKHDMEPAYEFMAKWVRELQGNDRAELLAELPVCLQEDHP